MNSRFLSTCLVVAILVGVSAEAWAQSANSPRRRQPKAGASASQEGTSDPADDPAAPHSDSFGSADGSTAKDPFDQAAGTKTTGTTSGGSTTPKLEKATFGAGCFWHVEAEFEWLPGVKSAVSGYTGGHVAYPSYEMVHEGETGHAEVVQVEYDPSVITYEQLLKVFWHGHDPTQWNRQGPDVGPQYRSVIFYHNDAQKKAALKSYRELTAARAYRAPIVTQLMPMKAFYRAEDYHQNYYGGKDDQPVARPSRSRRTARTATRKGTTTAKAAGAKKGTAVAKSAEGGRTGLSSAPASAQPHAEP